MPPPSSSSNIKNQNNPKQIVINVGSPKGLDDKLSSDEIEKDKIHEEFYFAEKRYCTVCNVEQPLRSKHCKDCNRCVALYDHHCPWTGKQNIFCFIKAILKKYFIL